MLAFRRTCMITSVDVSILVARRVVPAPRFATRTTERQSKEQRTQSVTTDPRRRFRSTESLTVNRSCFAVNDTSPDTAGDRTMRSDFAAVLTMCYREERYI